MEVAQKFPFHMIEESVRDEILPKFTRILMVRKEGEEKMVQRIVPAIGSSSSSTSNSATSAGTASSTSMLRAPAVASSSTADEVPIENYVKDMCSTIVEHITAKVEKFIPIAKVTIVNSENI